ncbi:hypothetical protein MNV49_000862 [Pseudohyphozyma bogoriensis]|nr:hypothetical protein MNV49_000862 [Pseudohyphozyma bogoriensis]
MRSVLPRAVRLLAPRTLPATVLRSSTVQQNVVAARFLNTSSPLLSSYSSHSSPADNSAPAPQPTASEDVAHAELSPETLPELINEASAAAASSSSPSPAAAPSSSSSSAETTAVGSAAAERTELDKRTVFVGGLSWNVDNEWLQQEVARVLEDESAVVSTRVARNNMGRSRGFAFIELSSPAAAEKLASFDTVEIDHRVAVFRVAEGSSRSPAERRPDSRDHHSGRPRNPPSTTVWLGNLSWSTTTHDLENLFSRFGDVVRVSLPTDAVTGRGRGIGYVEFSSQGGAEAAYKTVSEEGMAWEGREVRIDYAAVKSGQRNGNEGRRGGFGGRQQGQRRERW